MNASLETLKLHGRNCEACAGAGTVDKKTRKPWNQAIKEAGSLALRDGTLSPEVCAECGGTGCKKEKK